MSGFIRSRCIVLRTTRYRESDMILQCLSPVGSRLSFIARGAFKSKKRFSGGVLEPMHFIDVSYRASGSGGAERLNVLEEASVIRDFVGLRSDLDKLKAGFYVVKVVERIIQDGEAQNSALFDLVGHTLSVLELSSNAELVKVHFLIRLMHQQGILRVAEWMAPFLQIPMSRNQEISISLNQNLMHDLESSMSLYLVTAESSHF